ncbi:hypothetical protein APICC_08188 [Apis cerana cerana]|uniref:Uncharacterized protein n=1 Tax=Apis cerana cerana TaxID=94128 RepID=A0A2A3ENI0_APICC|nr:hypothetical protein APICC_08188 [Apis cerana cerana]
MEFRILISSDPIHFFSAILKRNGRSWYEQESCQQNTTFPNQTLFMNEHEAREFK